MEREVVEVNGSEQSEAAKRIVAAAMTGVMGMPKLPEPPITPTGGYVSFKEWREAVANKVKEAMVTDTKLTRQNQKMTVREVLGILQATEFNYKQKKPTLALRWQAFWNPLKLREAITEHVRDTLIGNFAVKADNDYSLQELHEKIVAMEAEVNARRLHLSESQGSFAAAMKKRELQARAEQERSTAEGTAGTDPTSYMHGELGSEQVMPLKARAIGESEMLEEGGMFGVGAIGPYGKSVSVGAPGGGVIWRKSSSVELTNAGKAAIAPKVEAKVQPVAKVRKARAPKAVPHRPLRSNEKFVDGKIIRPNQRATLFF